MRSLVKVASMLRWVIAAVLALCILHPVKADGTQATYIGGCESGCVTTYCYPPTGHSLK